MPQVRSVIATKGFHTFYDAEASALAAVSGGRRCEDLERRKVFTHSSTRKRKRPCAEEVGVAARRGSIRDERRRGRAQEKNTEARQRKHA